ncbi:MAG: hypothetical protein J6A92_03705 [Lachnospiraceae bacterium]|nr:hypothetical protein [Lachnospiraceae bacterium]
MKNLLVYWSRLTGIHKFWSLLLLLITIWNPRNMLGIVWVVYYLNKNSLTMFSGEKQEGNDVLTLSLPMTRKMLWDTRMWVMMVLYLLYGMILGTRTYENRLWFCMLCCLFLFSHICCGKCVRGREWYILSGTFGILFGFVDVLRNLNEKFAGFYVRLEENAGFLSGFFVLNVILLGLDICIWKNEGRIFIKGESDD